MNTNLTLMPSKHPHEDVFENYAFDRLSEEETADFEEHLLICDRCQETLAETDEYIQMMKVASAAYAAKNRRRSLFQFRFSEHGLGWNAMAAAAVLVLCGVSALFSWRNQVMDPQSVVLKAIRGDATVVSANRPLDLKLDLRTVPPAPGYRVEVVDMSGRRVWFGGTPAHISDGLARGTYWVRLSTDAGEFVQEYGLHVGQDR